MPSRNIIKKILSLELEEKILNGATLIAFVCVFMPWVGGEWLGGKTVTFNGLGFFTSFIGLFILLVLSFILLITIIPITGGPKVIRPEYKNSVRLLLAVLATLFTVAIWSVLTKFTFEFSRLQIHFGLYGTLIGSLVASLYSFILIQEDKKNTVNRLFSHNEEAPREPEYQAPDQGMPEDHRKYR